MHETEICSKTRPRPPVNWKILPENSGIVHKKFVKNVQKHMRWCAPMKSYNRHTGWTATMNSRNCCWGWTQETKHSSRELIQQDPTTIAQAREKTRDWLSGRHRKQHSPEQRVIVHIQKETVGSKVTTILSVARDIRNEIHAKSFYLEHGRWSSNIFKCIMNYIMDRRIYLLWILFLYGSLSKICIPQSHCGQSLIIHSAVLYLISPPDVSMNESSAIDFDETCRKS